MSMMDAAMAWARRSRVTTTPSRVEVNLRAIPVLAPGGWRLYKLDEWPLIGAAPKGYLAYGDPEGPDCRAFIAKRGRGTDGAYRECVTEEIISKIGAMLPVRMARSRLVRVPPEPGVAPDLRFLSQNFLRGGEELIHGIEIVGQYFDAKPEDVEAAFNLNDKASEQSFYTIHNMVEVLRWFCTPSELPFILTGFARMLAFDAFVGAPDRHALNWGVVQSRTDPGRARRFAPLFDTARGLYREHTDQKLAVIAATRGADVHVRDYAEKSKPVFGVRRPSGPRCNHFELVEHALRQLPHELGATMTRFINAIQLPKIEFMIARRFRKIITPLRVSFIVALLRYRHERLKILVRNAGDAK